MSTSLKPVHINCSFLFLGGWGRERERRGCSYSYSSNFPIFSLPPPPLASCLFPHASGVCQHWVQDSAPTLQQLQESRQHRGSSEAVYSRVPWCQTACDKDNCFKDTLTENTSATQTHTYTQIEIDRKHAHKHYCKVIHWIFKGLS